MIAARLKWLLNSSKYKAELAVEACRECGRGTAGFYLYSEILYAILEGLPLTCEDYELMDTAQKSRDLRRKAKRETYLTIR